MIALTDAPHLPATAVIAEDEPLLAQALQAELARVWHDEVVSRMLAAMSGALERAQMRGEEVSASTVCSTTGDDMSPQSSRLRRMPSGETSRRRTRRHASSTYSSKGSAR